MNDWHTWRGKICIRTSILIRKKITFSINAIIDLDYVCKRRTNSEEGRRIMNALAGTLLTHCPPPLTLRVPSSRSASTSTLPFTFQYRRESKGRGEVVYIPTPLFNLTQNSKLFISKTLRFYSYRPKLHPKFVSKCTIWNFDTFSGGGAVFSGRGGPAPPPPPLHRSRL